MFDPQQIFLAQANQRQDTVRAAQLAGLDLAGGELLDEPVAAFIDYLIEDFGDEWCTKYMFHYRWYPAEDADNAGTLLPLGMDVPGVVEFVLVGKVETRVGDLLR